MAVTKMVLLSKAEIWLDHNDKRERWDENALDALTACIFFDVRAVEWFKNFLKLFKTVLLVLFTAAVSN